MKQIKIIGACVSMLLLFSNKAGAQIDTLHVLAYNILYLGDTPPCQGPHSTYLNYLKTVIAYENPDIAGFEKMEAIPVYAGDASGNAATGFADSLLQYSLNVAFPGRYAYCPFTNTSGANNISILYYNQQKLGFAGILSSYQNITDFDTYKLYYKSADLATTHDSIFVYVTLNHTNSGSGSSDANKRTAQITGEMTQIATHFTTLPNMINMGDFNTHNSTEGCYQALVAPANPGYRYYDPPFYPDATFTYPADWDDHPAAYTSALSVSTRISGSLPNSCSGNSGGAKSWYDHIFLSANIINSTDHISYIPHSFRVVGNDGNRLAISVNAAPANTSVPSAVADAIFQMSEHYPVALDLLVNTATTSVATIAAAEKVIVVNPVDEQLTIKFPQDLVGKPITIRCIDALGRVQMNGSITAAATTQLPCSLMPGVYYLRISTNDRIISEQSILKK